MRYRVVPGPKDIKVSEGHSEEAFSTFADIINKEAKDGWIFHSMENLIVTEKSGCANLFREVKTNHYMLIFYKDE